MTLRTSDHPFYVDLTDGKEIVVNGIATGGYWGSQHVVCLTTNRAGVGPDGQLRSEAAIVARLRFDLDMAKQLRDMLDQQIQALAPMDKSAAN